ncbi:MAG: phage portal protein, partial [Clostridiales bacterium]|nr:phage portal protein [Clostridiales bacterium]
TAEDPTDFRSAARRLRQDRTLALPDSDAKAEWLLKNPVEKDIDVLRQALANDIHKFSMTPDFSDERFAGNLSGIAIKYKLFCLEQKIRLKERWLISGLRERARLMACCMAQSGLPQLDAEQLTIRLQRHLPEDDPEQVSTLRALAENPPRKEHTTSHNA